MDLFTARRSWTLIGVILLGLLWHLPALRAGLYLDDYLHEMVLEGQATPMSRWSLYDFRCAGEWAAQAVDGSGGLPFWTSADWSVRFFRPLTSAALVLEHALLGNFEIGHVLVGLGYFALVLLLMERMLCALGLAAGTSRLALLFLGAAGSTLLPVGWLANRNSLFEVLFLISAVLQAARGRELLAFLCVALAMLSKESGIIGLLLVPVVIGLREGGRWKPAAWLGLGLGCVYLAVLIAAGFGTRSAFYLTPWREPLRYVLRTLQLFAAGVPDLALPYPLDLIPIHSGAAQVLPILGLVLGAGIVLVVFLLGRGGRLRWFFVLWVLCAMGVQGSAPPSSRLLVVAAVPAAVLIAQAVRAGWRASGRLPRSAAALLFVLAGPLSGLATFGAGMQMAAFSAEIEDAARNTDLGSPDAGQRHAFVLQARNALVAFGIATTRWALLGGDVHFHLLQVGRRGLRWTRKDAATHCFESLGEAFFSRPFEQIYFTAEDLEALAVGHRWRGDGYSVELTGMDPDGGVRKLTLTFDEPSSPSRRFLIADGARLVPREPPAVGETLSIPAPSLPNPFIP